MSEGQGAASAAPSSLSDARLLALDQEIDQATDQGIRARWEFGRTLLRERVGQQLPKGRLDEVVKLTGKSRQELQFRMQFATRYETEDELSNAVRQFGSWHGIVNKGLAATVSEHQKKKKSKATTASSGARGVATNPEIIDWVAARRREGMTSKPIVQASKERTDFPGSKPLNDGAVSAIDAVLHDRKTYGRETQAKSKVTSEAGKRRYEATQRRAQARKDGLVYGYFWDSCIALSKATSFLESIGQDIDYLALDKHSLFTIGDLLEDLARLQVFQNSVYDAVQNKLGENNVRERIKKLRSKTVENGCTAEEADLSQRKADVLEQNLRHQLAS